LKAKAYCGTVTALTRTEFSIQIFQGFSSASRAGALFAGAVFGF
jgi:hypothetical protein